MLWIQTQENHLQSQTLYFTAQGYCHILSWTSISLPLSPLLFFPIPYWTPMKHWAQPRQIIDKTRPTIPYKFKIITNKARIFITLWDMPVFRVISPIKSLPVNFTHHRWNSPSPLPVKYSTNMRKNDLSTKIRQQLRSILIIIINILLAMILNCIQHNQHHKTSKAEK